jgi:hypothetical protein
MISAFNIDDRPHSFDNSLSVFIKERHAASCPERWVYLRKRSVDDLVELPALIATIAARLKEFTLLLFMVVLAKSTRRSLTAEAAPDARHRTGI